MELINYPTALPKYLSMIRYGNQFMSLQPPDFLFTPLFSHTHTHARVHIHTHTHTHTHTYAQSVSFIQLIPFLLPTVGLASVVYNMNLQSCTTDFLFPNTNSSLSCHHQHTPNGYLIQHVQCLVILKAVLSSHNRHPYCSQQTSLITFHCLALLNSGGDLSTQNSHLTCHTQQTCCTGQTYVLPVVDPGFMK